MDKKTIEQSIRQKQVEESIKQEFEQKLSERVARYLQVAHAGIIPYHYFAPASTECILLFRDGHFYGCISLVQAVAEATVRLLCRKNLCSIAKEFEENVLVLFNRGIISEKLKNNFIEIWKDRNDYHHLNPKVPVDYNDLVKLAKTKISLLSEIEKDIFAYTIGNAGEIKPKYSKYWETENQVYLRLE